MELKNISVLRGIAALAVTFFHLTKNGGLTGSISASGRYGYLGVELFFVISGFIIPYSMYKREYETGDFGRFIAKRSIRIYPPYIMMAAIAVLLMMITHRPVPSLGALLAHLFYLNGILGLEWVSPVFWTLALEFQFYLLIGLFYKWFISANNYVAGISILLVLVLGVLTPGSFLPHWFAMFALGIMAFRRMVLNIRAIWLWLSIAVISLFVGFMIGWAEVAASLFAVAFILFVKIDKNTPLVRTGLWFGYISYSLYLVHWDLGRSGAAVARHIPYIGHSGFFRLTAGLFISLLSAWIYNNFIESRFVKLSHKISYKSKRIP